MKTMPIVPGITVNFSVEGRQWWCELQLVSMGALNLQVMEFVSKGGGNCKYWNMTVKATGWKMKVMHFVGLEFASSGN